MTYLKPQTVLKAALAALLALIFASAGRADDDFNSQQRVTYSKDVAPILYKNCIYCHRPGEAAPMTLMNFGETRPWAKAIKKSVTQLEMPPWDANPAHGKWANDLSLSEKEIATIANWVDQGAEEGDPTQLPALPTLTQGWKLGEPDYIIDLDEVDVPATGNDLFPNMNVTIDIPEKKWLRALEVRPGDNQVLHHVVLFTSGFGMGAGGSFDALAVWAVGTPPVIYPEGMGRPVTPKMQVTANMHYHSVGTARKDKTRVGLYFGTGEMKKEITSALAGTVSFKIPPKVEDYKIVATYYINQDVDIVSLFPHMHMRGKEMSFTARYPDGRSEVLLDVPKYDFNWQWFYYPKETLRLPADTEVDIEAHYDNSANNPNNPDPNQELTFGEQSTEEMMFGFLEFVPVEGSKPKVVSSQRLLGKIAAKYPPEDAYSVQMSMGMMNLKSLMYLPRVEGDKAGEGMLYFTFGGSAMPIPLRDLKWDGNNFSFLMEFMGGRMGAAVTAKGTVDDTGAVTAKFEFDPAMLAAMDARRKEYEAEHPDGKETAEAPAEAKEGEVAPAEGGEGRPRRGGRRGGGGGGGFMKGFTGKRFSAETSTVSIGSSK